jgi:acetyl esterase
MSLHPQVQALLDQLVAMDLPPRSEMSPAQARERARLIAKGAGPGPQVADITDVAIDGPGGPVPLRVYQPPAHDTRGAVVYLHGGGWVVGGLDEFDTVSRMLCLESGCRVVSVGYRLAPEHPFPAALEDAYAAVRWAGDRFAGDLVLIGDSAGGNLAAVTAIRARDEGWLRIRLQVLVYPVTDADFDTGSYRQHGDSGLPLGRVDMEWFWDHYVPDPADRLDPRASPLRTPELSGLPQAIVVVAGFDPLCDEGLAYAARLQAAGVDVTIRRYDDMVHGFFTMGNILDTGAEALREVAQAAGNVLKRSPGTTVERSSHLTIEGSR